MSVTLQRLPVTIALSAYALVITLVLGLASGHSRGVAAEHVDRSARDDDRHTGNFDPEFLFSDC